MPIRCPWLDLTKPDYIRYHDQEWGVPVHDDHILFEFLTLESAQAGLSWYTILGKRSAYRRAFAQFDPAKVARFSEATVERLRRDSGIVRNLAKIRATVNNAQRFLDIQNEFGSFDAYSWRFVAGAPILNEVHTQAEYLATSPESDAFSKDLKQRGFTFIGSTTIYAYMQACGMVNDHAMTCFRRCEILAAT